MSLRNDDLLAIKELLKPIHDDIASIKMHLENVTDKNIKIIAEGYTDLARKLDNA